MNHLYHFIFLNTAKPYIISSSPTQLHQQLGATVQLYCRAKGTPEPEVIWSKNGIPLVNSKRVTIALDKESVEIRDLQRSDGGIYTCIFTNSMGAVSQRIDLIVEGLFERHFSSHIGLSLSSCSLFGCNINQNRHSKDRRHSINNHIAWHSINNHIAYIWMKCFLH